MYDTLVHKKVLSFAYKLLIYKTKHKHKQSNIETLGLGCELLFFSKTDSSYEDIYVLIPL